MVVKLTKKREKGPIGHDHARDHDHIPYIVFVFALVLVCVFYFVVGCLPERSGVASAAQLVGLASPAAVARGEKNPPSSTQIRAKGTEAAHAVRAPVGIGIWPCTHLCYDHRGMYHFEWCLHHPHSVNGGTKREQCWVGFVDADRKDFYKFNCAELDVTCDKLLLQQNRSLSAGIGA